MKSTYFKSIIGTLIAVSLNSCGNSEVAKPSIQDNSANIKKVEKVDYSGVEPSKLLKHIAAHYDLGQYEEGKEKLNYLMTVYPDTLDGINLPDLKSKLDESLLKQEKERLALAEAEAKKRLPSAVNKMRRVTEGKVTYFIDKTSPEFDSKECFYAYVKKDTYGAHLYFKSRYVGTQWLDMQNIMVTVDKLDHAIEGEIVKTETKGKKAYKHELLDVEITTPGQLNVLKAIANGKDVVALLIGKDSYRKRVISEEQRNAIRNVIDTYTYLGGDKIESFQEEVTNTEY